MWRIDQTTDLAAQGDPGLLSETVTTDVLVQFRLAKLQGQSGGVFDRTYMGIARSDGFVSIQITLSEGRSVAKKRLFYRTLAERLQRELNVRPEDVFVNLVEVKKENWSFGNGLASYAPAESVAA